MAWGSQINIQFANNIRGWTIGATREAVLAYGTTRDGASASVLQHHHHTAVTQTCAKLQFPSGLALVTEESAGAGVGSTPFLCNYDIQAQSPGYRCLRCCQIVPEMLPDFRANLAKHAGKCCQIGREIRANLATLL
jgi:hypothetical protein